MPNGNQNTDIHQVNVKEVKKHISVLMRRPVDNEKPTPDDINGATEFFKDFFNKPAPEQKAPPGCFFLDSDNLNILTHVPNFQGISIYLGKDIKENEILILVPVIAGSPLENLYTLEVDANGQPTTLSTSQVITGGTCPPLPPHCQTCAPCK